MSCQSCYQNIVYRTQRVKSSGLLLLYGERSFSRNVFCKTRKRRLIASSYKLNLSPAFNT